MPRVHYIAKARKDNAAVAKGQPYYWWKFRYGGKRYSATRPTRSQLTQSKFGVLYDAYDDLEKALASWRDVPDFGDVAEAIAWLDNASQELETDLETYAQAVTEVAEEYTEADEAMGGHYGINAERAEQLEGLASEAESYSSNWPVPDLEDVALEEAQDEAQAWAESLDVTDLDPDNYQV